MFDVMSRDANIAWAAGLFEGEGSIVPHRQARNGVRLQVQMTDHDVLARLQQVLGGKIYGPYRYAQPDGFDRKQSWIWTSDGADVDAIMREMQPWLGERRVARARSLGLLAQLPLEVAT